jgi:hypothetical protein
MLDVSMPQILLQGACIDACIRQVKATGMPQHMRANRKGEFCRRPDLGDDMMHRSRGERASPFVDKQAGHPHAGLLQLTEGTELNAPQGVDRRDPVFHPSDVQHRGFQIQHVPPEAHDFGDPQAMPIQQ